MRMLTSAVALTGALAAATVGSVSAPATAAVSIEVLGRYYTGVFDESASEIAAYDASSQRVFVTNSDADSIDVLDISDPAFPTLIRQIDITRYGDGINSVAYKNGMVAAAVEGDEADVRGSVAFFDIDGAFVGAVEVGYLPDMVTFTPDGQKVIVANEGEPSDEYDVDPVGSISIVDLSNGIGDATVMDLGFDEFTSVPKGMRIGKPGASLAQDLEPEYVAVSPDGQFAYVTLQENNGLAIVDIEKSMIAAIVGLGYKDHNQSRIDASNRDGGFNFRLWPVFGMYQPDSIAAYDVNGETYLVTANEGDARDYDGFSEEARVKDLRLDSNVFVNAAELQEDENLGRLKTTTTMGDANGDGAYEEIYAYGTRSFSIWDAGGTLVFDSGEDLELRTYEALPEEFNSTNDENGSFDDRSDDKGPEPEGLTIGMIDGRPILFLGLERVGGIMMYDISNPARPTFESYVNERNFKGDAEQGTAGDLAPEGLLFVPGADSPTGEPLLIVTNEVSGTTTIFTVVSN